MDWIYHYGWSCLVGVFLGQFVWLINNKIKNRCLDKLSLLKLEERIIKLEENLQDAIETFDIVAEDLAGQNFIINDLSDKFDEFTKPRARGVQPLIGIQTTTIRRKPGPKPKTEQ